jgi:hypothetical protein
MGRGAPGTGYGAWGVGRGARSLAFADLFGSSREPAAILNLFSMRAEGRLCLDPSWIVIKHTITCIQRYKILIVLVRRMIRVQQNGNS